jgi:uncharacterized membrane protein YjfL (UPF0719 family)
MDLKSLIIDDVIRTPAFIILFFILFFIASKTKNLTSGYGISDEVAIRGNPAIALAISGYHLAIGAIFIGALIGPSNTLWRDLMAVGLYSLIGLVLLNLSRWFNDVAILRKFSDTEQLVKERNIGVGAVHFGAYLATGLIAAGAISGEGGGMVSSIIFFVLGQLSLLVFAFIYEKLSPYDIHKQLMEQNTASGIAFGGHLIALAIIIMNASSGDFTDWRRDLLEFAWANLIAFIFLPIIRFAFDRLAVPGSSLSREIGDNRNIGAGLIEGASAISFAAVLAFLI